MRLFPGTLNVHLTSGSYPTPANALRLEKEEYGGRVSVSIVPCKIIGRRHLSFGLTSTPASMEIRLKGSLKSQQT
jgi:hypothetical protein